MIEDLIKRINELAHKSKTSELTTEEKEEQKKLRKQYLSSFREQLEGQLSNIKVVDPEGNDVTPDKVKELKKNKNNDSKGLK